MKTFVKLTLIIVVVAFSRSVVNAQSSPNTVSPQQVTLKEPADKTVNNKQGILDDFLIPISKIITLLSISVGVIIIVLPKIRTVS
jgi:hypothetical protein